MHVQSWSKLNAHIIATLASKGYVVVRCGRLVLHVLLDLGLQDQLGFDWESNEFLTLKSILPRFQRSIREDIASFVVRMLKRTDLPDLKAHVTESLTATFKQGKK